MRRSHQGAACIATKAIWARPAAVMLAASLILLAGCGSSLPPFVRTIDKKYQPYWSLETTISIVEVCYNRLTTTPEAVKRLAEEVCVEQGEPAVCVDHRILQCSLVRPVGAIFVCR